ncbi:hypothetical protein BY996DRAFT_6589059 [Phakopsora pachyrhizi]|nr:hypothetical protein BY996DRAFT_6589059 [Phakopsora pachyrhizi]
MIVMWLNIAERLMKGGNYIVMCWMILKLMVVLVEAMRNCQFKGSVENKTRGISMRDIDKASKSLRDYY